MAPEVLVRGADLVDLFGEGGESATLDGLAEKVRDAHNRSSARLSCHRRVGRGERLHVEDREGGLRLADKAASTCELSQWCC